MILTSTKTAEMVKYVCNCFHVLKVSFANEVGNICKSLGVDSHEVMDIFCKGLHFPISHQGLYGKWTQIGHKRTCLDGSSGHNLATNLLR